MRQAERMAKGRGSLTPVGKQTPSSFMEADMVLVGISAMPANAEGLLAAMQDRAEVLNDPVTGSPDEFWKMFAAYERLIKFY